MDIEALSGWMLLIGFIFGSVYDYIYPSTFGSTFDFITRAIVLGLPGVYLIADYYLKEYYRSTEYKGHFERD